MQGENTWLTKGFDMVDALLDWCQDNELYLILDLHAAPGGQGYDQGISDYDTSKPSLWESNENKQKMVALWGKLAERYKNEEWIGGYDILNEPNWNLSGNEIKNLYVQVTNAIRAHDTNHIIFIEGNWFANDFTGLTPPWDNNMVYSFHKYWNNNTQNTIQWVLDMRDQFNVPLWMGESGENSNVWFKEAIKLFEDNNIGWAWWPWKRIETIVSSFSIKSNSKYNSVVDYFKGNSGAPSAGDAYQGMLELAAAAKIENCDFRKGVIDAMLRQPSAEELKPFTVAKVIKVKKHPDADRLKVCNIKTIKGNFQVVCGAPNAREGMLGVFAPENSFIPGTKVKLKRSKIRGIESCGMLVSEREMGISDEHDEIIEIDSSNTKMDSGLKRFITYDSLSEFSFHVSGPLMMVYWLRDLKFDYIELAILINVSQVLGLFSMRYWGKRIDNNGSYSTIRFTSFCIGIFPMFWVGIYYLPNELILAGSIIIASLASLMFSGRALALDNRLYEHMKNKKMIKVTSKRFFFRGLSIFIGGLIGGLLTRNENSFSNYIELDTVIHAVMGFSTVLRLGVWSYFLIDKRSEI